MKLTESNATTKMHLGKRCSHGGGGRAVSDNDDGSDDDAIAGDGQLRSPVRCKKKPRSSPLFEESFEMTVGDHSNIYDTINCGGIEDRDRNGGIEYEHDLVMKSVKNRTQIMEKEKEKDKEMEMLKPPTLNRDERRTGAGLSVGKPLGAMYFIVLVARLASER